MRRGGGRQGVCVCACAHAPQSANICKRWARTQRALDSLHHNKLCDRFPQSPLAARRRRQGWPANSDAAPARAHQHERNRSNGGFANWKARRCQWPMRIEKKIGSPYFKFRRLRTEETQSRLCEMHDRFMLSTSTGSLWLEIVCLQQQTKRNKKKKKLNPVYSY